MNLFRSIAVAVSIVAMTPLPAFAQSSPSQTAPFAPDVIVSVNGLVCDFCAQSIDRSFRRRPEVNAVRVNLTEKLVSIDFRPNQTLDDATIQDIITRAGYTVTDVRRVSTTP